MYTRRPEQTMVLQCQPEIGNPEPVMPDPAFSRRAVDWAIQRARPCVVVLGDTGIADVFKTEGLDMIASENDKLRDLGSASAATVVAAGTLDDLHRPDLVVQEACRLLDADGLVITLVRLHASSPPHRAVRGLASHAAIVEWAEIDGVLAMAARPGETTADTLSQLALFIAEALADSRAKERERRSEIEAEYTVVQLDLAESVAALSGLNARHQTLVNDYELLGHRASEKESELGRQLDTLNASLRDAQADSARLAEVAAERDRVSVELERERAAAIKNGEQIKGQQAEIDRLRRYADSMKRSHGQEEQRAIRLLGAIEGYRTRIDRQHKTKTELQNQVRSLQYELRSLKRRKWWKAYRVITTDARRPWRLLLTPARLVRIFFARSEPEPRPEMLPITEAFPKAAPAPGRVDQQSASARVTGAQSGRAEPRSDQPPRVSTRERLLAPSRHPSLGSLRIASVLDEMSHASFSPDCELLSFKPDNWQQVLEDREPHLLLVESAWKGNGASWQYQVGTYAAASSVGLPHLTRLVDWCRERDVPTVFWNKEDPVHFDKFKEAAALFDVVLTTDENILDKYRTIPNSRIADVGSLPFAAQPVIHHPIDAVERDSGTCFAGTFYRNRHIDRQGQLEMLLDAALPYGLTIYDRMHGSESDAFGFPAQFDGAIHGGVPYSEMVQIYRRYKVFLNTNSVTESPTMFSRRVFELLACGTPVVSTPSVGVSAMFGDIVRVVANSEETEAAISALLHNPDVWREASDAGITRVMLEHTYAHRLRAVAQAVGLDVAAPVPSYSAVTLSDDAQAVRALADRLGEMLHTPQHVIHLASGETAKESPRVRVIRKPEGDRMAALRLAASLTDADYLLVGVPTNNVLEALLAATVYTSADVIGVAADDSEGYCYTTNLLPGAMIVARAAVANNPHLDVDDPSRSLASGVQVFGVRNPGVDSG